MTNENHESSLSPLEKIKWEVGKTFEYMQRMSEMGLAMITVSSLDDQLGVLLESFFVEDQKDADQILEYPGALSTFGARIELAFLLGLISSRERRLLNLIRKIRNDFAHEANLVSFPQSRVSFSQSPIKDRCRELDITKIVEPGKQYDLSDPAARFINASIFLWLVLIHRTAQIKHREEAESITEDDMASIIKKHSGEPE